MGWYRGRFKFHQVDWNWVQYGVQGVRKLNASKHGRQRLVKYLPKRSGGYLQSLGEQGPQGFFIFYFFIFLFLFLIIIIIIYKNTQKIILFFLFLGKLILFFKPFNYNGQIIHGLVVRIMQVIGLVPPDDNTTYYLKPSEVRVHLSPAY